ncbi:MAG: hypothetical protein IKT55_06645 [Clostridia bacterium]|nr:hypothetical protein [Clostridia bacterium]
MGCFFNNGNNCSWIIILIIIFLICGNGNTYGCGNNCISNDCGRNDCGCGCC